jgi:RNA polymerase sigma-70 factor (ECF subfamily)
VLSEDPATEVEAAMSTERAIALVSSLPPDQAEVLMLRIIADLDVGRTAQIVGKTPGAVRVLAHRGLRRLHEVLRSDVTKSDSGAVDG